MLAAILCAIVVVVGAWVRLTNAGLGCPDWPGCYGHVHPSQLIDRVAEINADNPDRPFDYQKALNEMVHRYIVGALGILVLALAALSVWNRRDPAQPRVLPWIVVALLVLQALLGMWTVTLLLKPLIVTLHLLGGLTTLALLWWLALPPERRELKAAERPVRRLAYAALVVLIAQISLGGWTSTNYAAAACGDFPACHGKWWPNMDFRNGFVLWRGLVIAHRAPDRFGSLLPAGLTMLLVGQALINMGVVLGMLPTTGIPLPFVSAGGSSLLVSMAAVGLLLSVSQHAR